MGMGNYEVSVQMNSPIILQGDRIRFDELFLAYDCDPQINSTSGLYHVSQSILSHPVSKGVAVLTDNINPHDLPRPKDNTIKIDPNSGVWQVYKRKVEFLTTSEIRFYFQGNSDFVKEALLDIGFLGAYNSIGFGEIKDLKVFEIDEDKSFVSNGNLIRSLPIGVSLDVNLGDKPLVAESYFEGFDDCYCTNSQTPCYNPIQI